MSEERVLAEAEFSVDAVRYHVLSATWGSAAVFGLIGLILTPFTFGLSLILLAVPLGIYALTNWYYTLYFDRLSCVLTDRKLKIARGVLVRKEQAIPLDKITDMAMSQGPILRHFKLEQMTVETAGSSAAGVGGALASLTGIKDSHEFRSAVLAQRDKVVGSAEYDSASSAAAPNPMSEHPGQTEVLIEIRDTLKRIESTLSHDHGA